MKRAFQPITIGGLHLKNRFIKSATYEGMYDQGLPNRDLVEHHKAMVKGGVALTTVAYGAVSAEGRTFSNQMYIHSGSLPFLKKLADEVHKTGGKVSMQLTHCGFFSKNNSIQQPLAPSRLFNAYGFLSGLPFSKTMDETDMDKVADDFAQSALSLSKIGFDAVELHFGHGYLLSQFLSPATNKRKDRFGGSIENRARFPMQVFERVNSAVGGSMAILVKLNLSDGFKGGFNLADCSYVAGKLEESGCSALVLSGGFTSKTPFYLLRGDVPLKEMIQNSSSFTEKLTLALFGPFLVKKYRFTPLFFLDMARKIRKAVKMPLAYLGGVQSREDIRQLMEDNFDLIALARPLIHDSNFLHKLRSGEINESACDRCNECIVEMDRSGVRCTRN